MTSAPSFRLLPVEATEAMRDAASAAVIAEWQAMIAEHRGAAEVARSFVSPSNFRLVLAAINAALSAAPVMAEATGWLPISSAPKDGTHILAWVCTRGSIRRGWPEICWWGNHPDFGPTWKRWNGREIVDADAALLWMPLPAPPALNAALAIAAGQSGS